MEEKYKIIALRIILGLLVIMLGYDNFNKTLTIEDQQLTILSQRITITKAHKFSAELRETNAYLKGDVKTLKAEKEIEKLIGIIKAKSLENKLNIKTIECMNLNIKKG